MNPASLLPDLKAIEAKAGEFRSATFQIHRDADGVTYSISLTDTDGNTSSYTPKRELR